MKQTLGMKVCVWAIAGLFAPPRTKKRLPAATGGGVEWLALTYETDRPRWPVRTLNRYEGGSK